MRKSIRLLLPMALLTSMALACVAQPKPTIVYVTEQGKKYHVKNCRLKHGSKGMKLSEAKSKGYKPCAVCKPPK